ncbi:unnamed protein product, partial [marine sediment metagenome]
QYEGEWEDWWGHINGIRWETDEEMERRQLRELKTAEKKRKRLNETLEALRKKTSETLEALHALNPEELEKRGP